MSGNEDYGCCTVEELRTLMEYRSAEAREKIDTDYSGIEGLCQKLKTDPSNGLSTSRDELDRRRAVFGANEIPPHPPKSFLQLVWEALQSAIVSLALSFYRPPDDGTASADESEHDTGWIEGVAILISVVVVVLVTALNDYTKERQFRGLQAKIETEHMFAVIRGGDQIQIVVNELVVGDIAQIKYGDLLPSDGILIQSNDLKIDESSLTGESDLIRKSPEHDPMLLSGTHVMEGSGKMLVTGVGVNSQTGIIMTLLGAAKTAVEEERKAAKREVRLRRSIAYSVSYDGVGKERIEKQMNETKGCLRVPKLTNHLFIAFPLLTQRLALEEETEVEEKNLVNISIFQSLLHQGRRIQQWRRCRRFRERRRQEGRRRRGGGQERTLCSSGQAHSVGHPDWLRWFVCGRLHCPDPCDPLLHLENAIQGAAFSLADFQHFINFLIIGVTVLVVAVPEGLPLAVTLSLAYSVKKMMHDNNLVRHLDACETMGNATSICSDKTGTLTTNRMTVVQSYINEVHYKETPKYEKLDANTRDLICNLISINSSFASQVLPPTQAGEQMTQLGNKTECGLLGFVLGLGQSYQEIRDKNPEESLFKVYTFNSVRKSMSTVINIQTPSGSGFRLFSKGASEIILKKCKWFLGKNGKLAKFSSKDCDRLVKDVIEPMASHGLRTIALAYKDYVPGNAQENQINFAGEVDWDNEDAVVNDLTAICIVHCRNPRSGPS
ncbi:hypothetical protein L596_010725 [Steinernema carpocapsae]|uniref:P-type Ca(2+) transporter n=1 Tax=Steinernema carpocapsae TaxID=34508 RepID=A0A4U5PJ53_STECR|nr:hypothetical protein L596_010725 [Steinernema carpocapsae]